MFRGHSDPRPLAVFCLAGTLALIAQAPKPAQVAMPPGPAQGTPAPNPAAPSLVDVNVASKAELMKLPGVTGPVADRIIQDRPYLSKAKLVSRGVIPLALFQQIRSRIVVHPKLPAKK
jgi:DNA uptake protein ComE-like DNA-binding protein